MNPFNLIQQFNAFKQNFQGDPRQKVEELLRSGQMTKEQFNQLYSQASEMYRTLGGNNGNNSNQPSGNPFSRLFGR